MRVGGLVPQQHTAHARLALRAPHERRSPWLQFNKQTGIPPASLPTWSVRNRITFLPPNMLLDGLTFSALGFCSAAAAACCANSSAAAAAQARSNMEERTARGLHG